jgi:hypothetical protein
LRAFFSFEDPLRMSTGPEGIVAGAVGSVGTGWNVFVSKPYKPLGRKLC